MRTRSVGGLVACLSLAGAAAAQLPAPPVEAKMTKPAGRSVVSLVKPDAAPVPADAKAPAADAPAPAAAPYPTVPAAKTPAGAYAYPSAPAATTFSDALAGTKCGPDGCPAPAADCAPASCCDCLCGPPGRFWVSAEYLYWVGKGQNLPPLVTAGPATASRATAGVLGQPGTQTLYGGNGRNYNDDWRSGFRLRAGVWLDQCQRFGLEGDFFFIGKSRDNFTAAGDGSQVITRPFFNVLQNRQDTELVSFRGTPAFPDTQLVSFPGVLAGSVSVRNTSDFIGGGFNFLCNVCCDPCGRLDVLFGYRYLNLRDEVTINENLTALPGSNVPAGTRFLIQDRFRTNNDFHGGNIGFNYERRFGSFFLGVRPSVALGVTHSTTTIDGSTTIIAPNGTAQVYPGGLLTQNSNIGRYTTDSFGVVPEIGVRAGVQVTEHLRAFVSYNYIYWSNVLRAGDQIDPRVNTNQIAPATALNGPALPTFTAVKSGYWVQGVGFGAEYRFR